MAKSSKKPIMSDIGLQMQETIDKTKKMKGHNAAREKLKEMEQSLSLIKTAFYRGCKHAHDMTANNEDFDASDEHKSKADKVINKIRVGWNNETTGARRDRKLDKIQDATEAGEGLIQINTTSPELQDFSTDSISDMYDQ